MHIIIIGSGIAALSCMKQLHNVSKITCITQSRHSNNSSYQAQGGICFSKYEYDDGQSHIEDTFHAGDGLGDRTVIQTLIKQSHSVIQQLIDEGLPFDRDDQGHLLYAMEGAHQHPRILHANGDQTGRIIMQHLASSLTAKPIVLYEHHVVIDLLKNAHGEACGVVTIDEKGQFQHISGDAVICATGGVSNLFTPHSSPLSPLSTGAVIAFHHHVPLQNMEMIQFHPTLLGTPQKAGGLISEAVRGAGATFVNDAGINFMDEVHPMKSLAPRDITSRMIFRQQQLGHQCYLDIRPVTHFEQRFPTITQAIRRYDATIFDTQRIPVTLGAHYTIGGISADTNGCTALPRFFAIGEAACTHFHGANRLASNSLLEGLVMGVNCATYIQHHLSPVKGEGSPQSLAIPHISDKVVQTLQQQSFSVLGVERHGPVMQRFKARLEKTLHEAPEVTQITKTVWQRYCTVKLLQIITSAALERQTSRGVHYRCDHPHVDTNHQYDMTEIYNGGTHHVKSIARKREATTVLHRG
ncbi:L-aspartate oxidase [Staphylococcus lutrae]|uniref:L-aspartate oxidase n=1 Tax=Staphylococcus lutrae TaxID=155085 RepID=A0AAC9WJB2_9STAP|nr:FAD-binding protein [Staphylococcus lutrae]ARJ50853.1 L-aspartate oxidase [Staphylococcus lutrae]PNZ39840.1 FAD-binding protein [Staphylococcus lutrae]